MELPLCERAHEAARAVVEKRWGRDRFLLELEREEAPRWNHTLQRSHYAASFRLFEQAGTARVLLGAGGPEVTFLVDPGSSLLPPHAALEALTPADRSAVERAVGEAARRTGRTGTLRVAFLSATPLRPGTGRALEVLVRLLAAAEDGAVELDLDATTGERLGYFVPAFLRGSRSGRPLSAREAATRAEAEEPLPPGADLGRAELEERRGTRAWRLRWDATGPAVDGHVFVCAHARTGAVAGFTLALRARAQLGERPGRAEAERLVRAALPSLLGPDSRLALIVPGALVRGGKPRAGWVGTAVTEEGEVVRVSCSGEEVEVNVGGRLLRIRPKLDAVAVAT